MFDKYYMLFMCNIDFLIFPYSPLVSGRLMSDRSRRNITRVDFNVLHNSGCNVKKTRDSDSELETF